MTVAPGKGHPDGTMPRRVRNFLVLAGCVAVLATFLAHLPACSTQYLAQHQPVTALRALDPGNLLEAAVGLPAMLMLSQVVTGAAPLSPAPAEEFLELAVESPSRALTCSYLC